MPILYGWWLPRASCAMLHDSARLAFFPENGLWFLRKALNESDGKSPPLSRRQFPEAG